MQKRYEKRKLRINFAAINRFSSIFNKLYTFPCLFYVLNKNKEIISYAAIKNRYPDYES